MCDESGNISNISSAEDLANFSFVSGSPQYLFDDHYKFDQLHSKQNVCEVNHVTLSKSDSPKAKIKSSPNFSIFGHILNKRPDIPKASAVGSNTLPSSSRSRVSHTSNNEPALSSEKNEGTQSTQVKTRIRSMWNNVKYGWRMKREVSLKADSAVWLLGKCYHNKLNDGHVFPQDAAKQLKLDLLSKIWLTYRINFPAIPGTNLISDSGWGCMLRSGQMMMAQALICHFLNRDWRLSLDQPPEHKDLYKMILRWFGDSLSENNPFSLHHLVGLGEIYGRKAGDWYGPTHAAHVLRDALNEAKKCHPLLQHICMYVASDGIVFKQDVLDLCMDFENEENDSDSLLTSDFANISMSDVIPHWIKDFEREEIGAIYMNCKSINEPGSFENPCPSYTEFGPPSYGTVKQKFKSLILFVSVRLGNDKINPFYIPCLKSLLAYEHCIGIIGGRPKHALYFIGWQDDKIIHMDPHSCQPAIDVDKEDFCDKSFHSSSVRMLSFSEMDPSCAIGFYFKEHADFQFFLDKFSEITAPLKRNLEYPVFALAEGRRTDIEEDILLTEKSIFTHSYTSPHKSDDDDDDYILL